MISVLSEQLQRLSGRNQQPEKASCLWHQSTPPPPIDSLLPLSQMCSGHGWSSPLRQCSLLADEAMSSREGLRQIYSTSQGQGLTATFCSLSRMGVVGQSRAAGGQSTDQGAVHTDSPDPLAGTVLDVIPGTSWHSRKMTVPEAIPQCPPHTRSGWGPG